MSSSSAPPEAKRVQPYKTETEADSAESASYVTVREGIMTFNGRHGATGPAQKDALAAFVVGHPPSEAGSRLDWIFVRDLDSEPRPASEDLLVRETASSHRGVEAWLKDHLQADSAESSDDGVGDMPGSPAHRTWVAAVKAGHDSSVALAVVARRFPSCTRVGKWMLFVPWGQIDEVWAEIAQAVVSGELGPSAKVGPQGASEGPQALICVYTYDFTDVADRRRVRARLRALGHAKPLSYKPDVFTYWDVYSGNRLGVAASIDRL